MRVDLHTHSTASDGELAPQSLIDLAVEQDIELFSITDHDTLAAYQHLNASEPITVVPGIELSTQWAGVGIHIVGLNIALDCIALQELIDDQQSARQRRARLIALRLAKRLGVDLFSAASRLAGDSTLGRPHFAQAMVDAGLVADHGQAFKKYLGRGKPGDVKAEWPDLERVVRCITASNGVAVLAHPLHYKMTNTKLRLFLQQFIAAGGRAIEVVSGAQSPEQTAWLARLSTDAGLLASCGSDFHRRTQWSLPGKVQPLPPQCRPVWEQF